MSDLELRELERRWRTSRSDEDGVAWLRARLRLGLVDLQLLEVAALCGSEPARELLPEVRPERKLLDRRGLADLCGVTLDKVTKWSRLEKCPNSGGARPLYDPVAVMAWRRERLAFQEEAWTAWQLLSRSLFLLDPRAAWRAAISAVWVAFLVCPDPVRLGPEARTLAALEAALLVGGARPAVPGVRRPMSSGQLTGAQAVVHLRLALHDAAATHPFEQPSSLSASFRALMCAGIDAVEPGNMRHMARLVRASSRRIFEAIEQEVAAWALGLEDPVAERIARRQREPEALIVPSFPEPLELADDEDPRAGAPSKQQLDVLRSLLERKAVGDEEALRLIRGHQATRLADLEGRQVARLIGKLRGRADRGQAAS